MKSIYLRPNKAAGEQDKFIVTFVPRDSGRVQVFSIPRSDAKKLPNWIPGAEEPPLSVGEAVTASRKCLKILNHGSDELPLDDVHLVRKKSVGMRDVGFYRLLFATSTKKRHRAGPPLSPACVAKKA